MCLGVPGKVTTIKENFADVDFGGIRRKVSLLICPDIEEGDYVLVHVGFAIQKIEASDALETLRLLGEIDEDYHKSIEGD